MTIRVPKQLADVNRKTIRYIMFRMKYAQEKVFNDKMRIQFVLDSLPEYKRAIAKKVVTFYSGKPGFTGWEDFSVTWDIGCDDAQALHNWDDPTRIDKWWTFGISRFRVVSRPGMPTARNEAEGVTRQFGGPMEFFVATGYATPHNGGYKLDVDRLLAEVPKRKTWGAVVYTTHSLHDMNEFENFYRADNNVLIAGEKTNGL